MHYFDSALSGYEKRAIDYIVLCASNQGQDYANGRDARGAVLRTLEEDKRLRSAQLRGIDVSDTMIQKAIELVKKEWNA